MEISILGHYRADPQVLGTAAALEQAFAGSKELQWPRPALDRIRSVEHSLTSIVTAPSGPGGGAGDTAVLTSAAECPAPDNRSQSLNPAGSAAYGLLADCHCVRRKTESHSAPTPAIQLDRKRNLDR